MRPLTRKRSALRNPDDALLRELYDAHARELYGFALKLTGQRERAEDVVQETLLRAWRSPRGLSPEMGPARPFLFAIARNVITDMWRADQVRPQISGNDDGLELLAGPDEYDQILRTWQLEEALTRLSSEHREVLMLCHLQSLSIDEAASVLRVPPGTVKSRTYYAMRALRLALEEMGVSTDE